MALVDVVLTAGQSNMEGVGDYTLTPSTDPDLCFEWDGGPGLVQVADPTSCAQPYRAETGSMLPKFSKTFVAASGKPLVIVRAALGGTALLPANANSNGDWSPTGTLFDDSVTRLTDALTDIATLGHTVDEVHVVWSQGHSDAAGGNDLHLYQAATEALVGRWRTATGIAALKVYMELLSSTNASSSTPPAHADWQTVRDAQIAACASTDGLEMAFTEGTEYYERHWLRFDNLHYSQAGYNYMGQKFAEYMAADLGMSAPDPGLDRSPSSATARLLLPADAIYGNPMFITPGEHPWTVPPGVTEIGGEAIGAGGGGGGPSSALGDDGGGGCGGAYASDASIAVTPGEELTVVVGAAGTGGSSGAGGTDGGQSGLKRGGTWLLRADGGPKGLSVSPWSGGSNASQVANSIGDVKTAGTSGTTGASTSLGHGGAAASGGTLTGGAGGTAVTTGGAFIADAGDAPGGGGAGKRNSSGSGGAGGVGVVKLDLGDG